MQDEATRKLGDTPEATIVYLRRSELDGPVELVLRFPGGFQEVTVLTMGQLANLVFDGMKFLLRRYTAGMWEEPFPYPERIGDGYRSSIGGGGPIIGQVGQISQPMTREEMHERGRCHRGE